MLYKNNILKYSFLSAGLAYLLTSTAFAQSPLDGTETNSLPALSLENSAPEERPLVGQDDDGSLNPGDSIAPAEGGAPVNGENQLNGGDEALLPQGGDNTEIFAAPENVNDPLFCRRMWRYYFQRPADLFYLQNYCMLSKRYHFLLL